MGEGALSKDAGMTPATVMGFPSIDIAFPTIEESLPNRRSHRP